MSDGWSQGWRQAGEPHPEVCVYWNVPVPLLVRPTLTWYMPPWSEPVAALGSRTPIVAEVYWVEYDRHDAGPSCSHVRLTPMNYRLRLPPERLLSTLLSPIPTTEHAPVLLLGKETLAPTSLLPEFTAVWRLGPPMFSGGFISW